MPGPRRHNLFLGAACNAPRALPNTRHGVTFDPIWHARWSHFSPKFAYFKLSLNIQAACVCTSLVFASGPLPVGTSNVYKADHAN